MLQRRALTCLISALLINGCGSDSVTNITIIEVPKSPQAPLVFSAAEQSYYIDETPEANRVSGGSGAGNLVYTSSNPEIATVDADTGLVTLLDDGSVTITATKAGDDIYGATSASYALTVSKYDRWYNTQWQFVEREYTVAMADNEVIGNTFIPTNQTPVATTQVTLEANLPAANHYIDPDDFNPNDTTTFNASVSWIIYDSLGESHLQSLYFIKEFGNEWLMVTAIDDEFYDITNADGTDPADAWGSNDGPRAGVPQNYVGFGQSLYTAGGTATNRGIWGSRLVFDSSGDYIAIQAADGESLPTGVAGDMILPTTVAITGLTTGADASQTIAFNTSLDASGTQYDGFSQYASPFEISRLEQDGLPIGTLDPALVSYHSDDTNIALVNENTGWLTLISNGETEITAIIAEDDYYAETQVSYRLIVQ